MKDIIVAGKYRVDRMLGEGGFGVVYAGTEVHSKEKVAIKFTHQDHDELDRLCIESQILQAVAGGPGIPKVYWFDGEYTYNLLVQEILGASLEDLLNYCGRRFSLKTVLLLAIQAISRLEHVHRKGYLHCDVKPSNFLMGLGKQANTLYIVDFGISVRFRPQENPDEGGPFIGTRIYGSINAHNKIEQSWRDDMESLGYMLVYFFNGSLPWSGLEATDSEETNTLFREKKCSVKVDDLCAGLPAEFATYMNYVRGLAFNQRPDYAFLRHLFHQLYRRSEFGNDMFDWTEKMMAQISSLPPPTHESLTERPQADTPGC